MYSRVPTDHSRIGVGRTKKSSELERAEEKRLYALEKLQFRKERIEIEQKLMELERIYAAALELERQIFVL